MKVLDIIKDIVLTSDIETMVEHLKRFLALKDDESEDAESLCTSRLLEVKSILHVDPEKAETNILTDESQSLLFMLYAYLAGSETTYHAIDGITDFIENCSRYLDESNDYEMQTDETIKEEILEIKESKIHVQIISHKTSGLFETVRMWLLSKRQKIYKELKVWKSEVGWIFNGQRLHYCRSC